MNIVLRKTLVFFFLIRGLLLLADWRLILNLPVPTTYFHSLNSSSAFAQQADRPAYFTVFYLRFA